jgi:hypothetical protein
VREDFGAISSPPLPHFQLVLHSKKKKSRRRSQEEEEGEEAIHNNNLKRKNEKTSAFVDFFIRFHQLC